MMRHRKIAGLDIVIGRVGHNAHVTRLHTHEITGQRRIRGQH